MCAASTYDASTAHIRTVCTYLQPVGTCAVEPQKLTLGLVLGSGLQIHVDPRRLLVLGPDGCLTQRFGKANAILNLGTAVSPQTQGCWICLITIALSQNGDGLFLIRTRENSFSERQMNLQKCI